MKRKLSMILALSATLAMLAACSNTNDGVQAELDKNLLITQSATAAETETNSKQNNSISEETIKESTSANAKTITEANYAKTEKYAEVEMPVPFQNEGGDINAKFYSTVDLKLNYLSMQFINLVDQSEFESWLDNTSSSSSEYTSIADLANLYSFIKHFDIPDETVREILINLRNGSEDDFSDEEIELIMSNDDEAVAKHFVAETAIIKGSDIYSLKWIYYHSTEDYATVGITEAELEATLPMFDSLTLTDEATQAIEMKINSYAAVTASNIAE